MFRAIQDERYSKFAIWIISLKVCQSVISGDDENRVIKILLFTHLSHEFPNCPIGIMKHVQIAPLTLLPMRIFCEGFLHSGKGGVV